MSRDERWGLLVTLSCHHCYVRNVTGFYADVPARCPYHGLQPVAYFEKILLWKRRSSGADTAMLCVSGSTDEPLF